MLRRVSTRKEQPKTITIRLPGLRSCIPPATWFKVHGSTIKPNGRVHKAGCESAAPETAITKVLSALRIPSPTVSILINGISNAEIPHKYLLLLFKSFNWKLLVHKMKLPSTLHHSPLFTFYTLILYLFISFHIPLFSRFFLPSFSSSSFYFFISLFLSLPHYSCFFFTGPLCVYPYKGTVKVKFTLEQAMKAHRGSRGIALLFP
jgi:hypothetical protein